MNTHFVFGCAFLSLIFCQNVLANLIQIPLSSLSSPVTESFESTPTSNYENLVKGGGIVLPGINTNYTWPSGMELTNPIPNYSNDDNGLFNSEIAIFDTSKQQFSFGDSVGILYPPGSQGYVPDGNKFLIEAGASSDPLPFGITFPGNGASKIGGYWIMSGQGQINFTAHGVTGDTIGSITDNGPFSVNNWPSFAFESSSGEAIKEIDISTTNGANPGVDELEFAMPVPEPASGALVAAAAIFGGIFLRLKRRGIRRR